MTENEEFLYEPHSNVSDEVKWKTFKIEPCCICKKTPTLRKDFNFTNDHRYKLSCCIGTVGGYSETLCMTRWNSLNEKMKGNTE